MYTQLSRKVQKDIESNFRLRYHARSMTGVDYVDWNTTINFVRKEKPEDRPIELFKMIIQKDPASMTCRIKNLKECMPTRISELMSMRVFLLDLVVRDFIRSLIADNYRSLFVYSPIPHVTEIFMDHKFKIRKRIRKNQEVVYLGYKKIQ